MGVNYFPEAAEQPRQGGPVAGLGQASAGHPRLELLYLCQRPGGPSAPGIPAFSGGRHEELQRNIMPFGGPK